MSFTTQFMRAVVLAAALLAAARTLADPAPLTMQNAVVLALQRDSVLRQLTAENRRSWLGLRPPASCRIPS